MFSAALYAHVRTSSTIAHETAGAARIRHSLRPLFGEGVRIPANLGRRASRECETVSTVIASAAKQSMSPHEERMDCFASLAMTWIGSGPTRRMADPPPGARRGVAKLLTILPHKGPEDRIMDNRSEIWRGVDEVKPRFIELSDRVWAMPEVC